jgi:hypothetical protein
MMDRTFRRHIAESVIYERFLLLIVIMVDLVGFVFKTFLETMLLPPKTRTGD